MEISYRIVTQWGPSRLKVPFGVALPPTANVEKLLGAKTGFAVLDEEEEESFMFAKDSIVTKAFHTLTGV